MYYFSSSYRMFLALVLVTFVQTQGQAESRQIRLPLDQIYTNKATQFQFPPHVANFQREAELTQYDPQGRDIGVGYNDPVDAIAATVFVYPIAQTRAECPAPSLCPTQLPRLRLEGDC